MSLRAPLLLVALTGCWVSDDALQDALDRDGDGHLPVEAGGDDCDETDPAIHPGAPELCGDGLDNDCDGAVDDDGLGSQRWYADEDADGHGRAAAEVLACSAPPGHVASAADCDDTDPMRHPDADDVCNEVDDDCDGFVDEDEPAIVQFVDTDGDGRGDFDQQVRACSLLTGHSLVAGDCDDTDPTVYVGAADNDCDDVDDDCDGEVDEDAPFANYWLDADGDAWGDVNAPPVRSCVPIPGSSQVTGDCDDSDATRHPTVVDVCNGIDDDCDGVVDEDAPTTLYHLDLDGDGVGGGEGILSCGNLPDGVLAGGDCDDADPSVRPGLQDLCDGIDQDCDGEVDEDADATSWYPDQDGDNWGATSGEVVTCMPPSGYVADPGDCDDGDGDRHPMQADLCNDVDDDCDGVPDEDAVFQPWYPDDDDDGWGRTADGQLACAAPSGHVEDPGDCDDGDSSVHPDQTDLCDDVDEDCDGDTDEDAVFQVWYPDDDGDFWGRTADGQIACQAPPSHVEDGGDCDDADSSVHPNLVDFCNDLDDDCDGATDEDATFAFVYPDQDGDGLGDGDNGYATCAPPPDSSNVPGDCDDTRASVTTWTWFPDADSDGVGALPGLTVCDRPTGYQEYSGDCDDTDDEVHPGASEVCGDGRDNDCDRTTDCFWSGVLQTPQADLELLPPAGWRLSTVPDMDGDEVPELVAATPSDTRVWFDAVMTPDFTAPADLVLPAGCEPVSVVLDGSNVLVCSEPGRVRVYDQPGPARWDFSSSDPTFGRTFAADPTSVQFAVGAHRRHHLFAASGGTLTDQHSQGVFHSDGELVSVGSRWLVAYESRLYITDYFPRDLDVHDLGSGRDYGTGTSIHLLPTIPQTDTDSWTARVVLEETSPVLLGRGTTFTEDELVYDGLDDTDVLAEGLPNEAVLPHPVRDLDGDHVPDFAFVTTGAYSRVGIARSRDGLTTSADITSWFLKPGTGASLTLQPVVDVDSDGEPDLVFQDEAGALYVFLRERE